MLFCLISLKRYDYHNIKCKFVTVSYVMVRFIPYPLLVLDVENGHTLHLVERQPAQSQPSPDTSSGERNGNNSNRGIDMYIGACLVCELQSILLKAAAIKS